MIRILGFLSLIITVNSFTSLYLRYGFIEARRFAFNGRVRMTDTFTETSAWVEENTRNNGVVEIACIGRVDKCRNGSKISNR